MIHFIIALLAWYIFVVISLGLLAPVVIVAWAVCNVLWRYYASHAEAHDVDRDMPS